MSQIIINTGNIANDGTGDPLRTAFNDTNNNFTQLFNAGPVNSNIAIANNTIQVTNTNGNLRLATNGIGVIVPATNIVPDITNTRSIGTATKRFNTVFSQYVDANSATLSGNLYVGGNLNVVGNTITNNYSNADISNLVLTLAVGSSNAVMANGAGIKVASANANFVYNYSANTWNSTLSITAPAFIGDGSQLTNVNATINANNLAGNTLSSSVTNSSLTSFGTVGNMSVAGDVVAGNVYADQVQGNIIEANYLYGDGSNLSNLTGSAIVGNVPFALNANAAYTANLAALATQAINADTALFAINANLAAFANVATSAQTANTASYSVQSDNANSAVVAGMAYQIAPTANISVVGNITTSGYFIGNGSQLTGIVAIANYSNANVAAYLPTYSGNLPNVNTITTSGDIDVGGIINLPDGIGYQYTTTLTGYGSNTAQITFQLVCDQSGTQTEWQAGVDVPGTGYEVGQQWTYDSAFLEIPGASVTVAIIGVDGSGGVTDLGFTAPPLYPPSITRQDGFIALEVNDLRWTYGLNGNLTLPNLTSAINYSNGVSILDNIAANYGNSNVASFLADFGSNNVITTGSITAGEFDVGANLYIGPGPGGGSFVVANVDTGLVTVSQGANGQSYFGWAENLLAPGNLATITFNTDSGAQGNVVITTGSDSSPYQWKFDNTGTTTFPTGGLISNYPGLTGANTDSWFVTPGNGIGGISSQDGQQYIQVNDDLFIEIGAGYGTANSFVWQFGLDGTFALDGNINTTGNIFAHDISVVGNINGRLSNGNSGISIAQNGNITLGIGPFATTHLTVDQYGINVFGDIVGNYLYGDGSNITNLPTSNFIVNGTSYANIPAADGNLDININSNNWTFGTDGSTIFPNASLYDDITGTTLSTANSWNLISPSAVRLESGGGLGQLNLIQDNANSTGRLEIIFQNDLGTIWTFDETGGNLTLPNSTVIGNAVSRATQGPAVNSFGSDSYTGTFTTLDYTDLDTTWIVNGPGVVNGTIQAIDAAGQNIILTRSIGSPQFQNGQSYTFTGPAVSIGTNITVNGNSWTFSGDGNLRTPQGGYIGPADVKGQGTMLSGGTGNLTSVTSYYADAPGIYSSCLTANPDGTLNITTYGNGTGQLGQWQFANANLTLPQGGVISEDDGNVIVLTPSGGASADQQLLIYPTTVDSNHLHLTSGNLYNAELFLGNDELYVKLANTGNVVINSNDSLGNTAQWIFGADGTLTVPGNLKGNGASPAPSINGFDTISAINLSASGNVIGNIFVLNNAGNLTYSSIQKNQNPPYGSEAYGIELYTTTDDPNVFSSVSSGPDYVALLSTNAGNANVILQGGYGVTISTSNATGAAIKEWSFVASGNTSFPGNLSVAGNVTGNYILGDGGLLSNIAIGNGAPVSTTGNVSGGNLLSTGTISASGNIYASNFIGNLSNGASRISVANSGNVSVGIGPFSTTVLTINSSTGISVLGNIIASGYMSLTGNVGSNGNISALGNITSNANVITVAASGGSGTAINGAGIQAGTGIATILYDNSVFGWTTNQGFHPTANTTQNLGRSNRYWNNLYAVNLNGVNQAMSGYVSAVGNVYGDNIIGNGSGLTGVAKQTTGSWTVTPGTNNYSFTVNSGTYNMWVTGNIPNGIIVWNAIATVTNTNVPVVGQQYAWVYNGGGTPIDFVSIPNQFVGTGNAIVRSNVAPSATTNRFDFSINNTSGGNVTVSYGYTAL